MTESRLTPDGLPVVTQEVREVFIRDIYRRIHERTGIDFAIDICKRCQEENPEIYQLIQEVCGDNGEERERVLCGFSFTYELLRRQAEANKMAGSQE